MFLLLQSNNHLHISRVKSFPIYELILMFSNAIFYTCAVNRLIRMKCFFKPFSHRVVYPSSIYGFWLALGYLQSLLTTLDKLLFSLDHRDFMERSALFTKAFETLWWWILLETVDNSVSNRVCNDIMEGSIWKVSKCY